MEEEVTRGCAACLQMGQVTLLNPNRLPLATAGKSPVFSVAAGLDRSGGARTATADYVVSFGVSLACEKMRWLGPVCP
jgi:hypothetical protein